MLLRGLEAQPPQSFISSRQEQQRQLKAPAAQLLLGLATETRGKRLHLHPKTLDKRASQQDASVSAAAGGHQPDFHAAEMGTIPEIKAGMLPAERAESWSHQAGRPPWLLGRPPEEAAAPRSKQIWKISDSALLRKQAKSKKKHLALMQQVNNPTGEQRLHANLLYY